MKRMILILCILAICPPVYARGKNLYHLVEGKKLKVYLSNFQSDTEKISPEDFKTIFRDSLIARKKENFEVVEDKESADVLIDCNILSFKYLEKDPIDNVIGGTTALIVDALVSQNYAKVQVDFSVIRASDNRRLWHDRFVSSVTESDMPEPDSIPKVLKECSKRFIFLCFGKPKR